MSMMFIGAGKWEALGGYIAGLEVFYRFLMRSAQNILDKPNKMS